MRDYRYHLETSILDNWLKYGPDYAGGGFFGVLDSKWNPSISAPKGVINQARILWFLSAVNRCSPRDQLKREASRQLEFILDNFKDRNYKGFYWSIDATGIPLDSRKHVYAQSFVIYALAEYARSFDDSIAKEEALDLFQIVDDICHDEEDLGYFESHSKSWEKTPQHEDMGGFGKSMNSHIHMLEALTTLYEASKDGSLRDRLNELIDISSHKIFDSKRNSLNLFFEDDWTSKNRMTSFGHDIELSWLLHEASGSMGREESTKDISLALAHNSLKAVTENGLLYEGDSTGKIVNSKREWWVQAEGLVGFLNAYNLSGDKRFLEAFEKIEKWTFESQVDQVNGDWIETISENGDISKNDKGHLWKDPYHQGRACLELIRRRL